MKLRLATPEGARRPRRDQGPLRHHRRSGKTLWIGATTTHAEIAASARRAASPARSSPRRRRRSATSRSATAARSAARSPTPTRRPTSRPSLVALGATIVAKGPKGERKIPADKFFVDLFTTALKPGEIVTAILVPPYGKGTGGAYLKHPHPASRYAVVGVAALVEVKDGKVARASLVVGGATPNPVRAAAAEAALDRTEARRRGDRRGRRRRSPARSRIPWATPTPRASSASTSRRSSRSAPSRRPSTGREADLGRTGARAPGRHIIAAECATS